MSSRAMLLLFKPAGYFAVAIVFLLILFAGGYSVILWLEHVPFDIDRAEEFLRIRDQILLIVPRSLALAYALFRVLGFHPVFRPSYQQWLAATPYNGEQPLPLGPIHLGFRDVVSLAALMLVAAQSRDCSCVTSATVTAMAFFIPYLLVIAASLRITGESIFAYTVAFGVGATFLATPWPAFTILAILFTYVIACQGLRRSLRTFPWQRQRTADPAFASSEGRAFYPLLAPLLNSSADRWLRQYGWPLATLQPCEPRPRISVLESLSLSLLIGWIVFAIGTHTPRSEWNSDAFVLLYVLLPVVALVRLSLYMPGHCPPISLFGRITTRRIVIPGYDRVFAAPIAATLGAFAGPAVLMRLGVHVSLALPIAIALCLFILLAMGPTLRDWRLSAPCRLRPALLAAQQSQLVKV